VNNHNNTFTQHINILYGENEMFLQVTANGTYCDRWVSTLKTLKLVQITYKSSVTVLRRQITFLT